MFEHVEPAPPDAILGLTDAFKQDSHPGKINLGVGVYKDDSGVTPTLACVKEAERRRLDSETSKAYFSITGLPEYGVAVQELLLGGDHEAVASRRTVTVQTPGGTGALRVAADFVQANLPGKSVWMSDPTWANHSHIFAAAGLKTATYPYFDAATNSLDFDAMLAGLSNIPSGDIVLLHACCHNPTGIDPTPEQWSQIGDVVSQRGLLPLVDFAYQGFGEGVTEDAVGLRSLARAGCEMLVCNSFSKNFGLYRERIGALSILAADAATAEVVLSQVKRTVRTNYSNPPAHGAIIVATILGDSALRQQWREELSGMRDRINGMRQRFVDVMQSKAPNHDFSFIGRQQGMFSFSGLSPVQVDELRTKHSIYIVGSGRINIAGITESNIDPLCTAIASVL